MAKKDKEFEYEYNPIKEQIGGKEAERVIWSTKAFETAIDGITKGLPLKANPFVGKNTKLLKPDLVYKRTEEEIEDYIHCMQDPVYFASKCYIMTPTGLQPCVLRDYQIEYLHHLQNHRFSLLLACRQAGKTLNMLTNVKIKLNKNDKIYDSLLKKYDYYIKDNYIYIDLPIFEIYHICSENSIINNIRYSCYKLIYKYIRLKIITKILYKILSLLDNFDYKYIHTELTDGYKTIQEIHINNIEILTDTGYKPITNMMISRPFEQYIVTLENGYELNCADRHILFDEYYNEVFVEDLHVGDKVITDEGPKKIIRIKVDNIKVSMCDLSVDDNNHRFYSNGILSHNSVTTAIYCLWVILFNTDKQGLILSKSGPAGQDLLAKIKDMYLYLPYHLKVGTMKWNQSSISFDNNSSISTEAFSPTAGLGKTINFLILDEFAWCPPNEVELFYNNIIPTVTTISNSNVCIMSTQNGFNLFYKLHKGAVEGTNIYAPFKIDWEQVPQYNPDTDKWEKRTEEWHKMMAGVLGSEEAFQYQYGTKFAASDCCLVSRECLARLHDNALLFENKDELEITLQHKDCLYWHPNFNLEELKTGWFIVLCDLAEGGGADSTVFNIMQITGKDKFKQVGYWKSNSVELKLAALEFWLLFGQLFTNDRCLFSIEWNTYGSLFYNYIVNLNEAENMQELNWRFNICQEVDVSQAIQYKKTEEDIAGQPSKTSKSRPGLRFSAANKSTSCSLLKMELENGNVEMIDLRTIGELDNFEDKNGSGTYKASYGHDDMVMTFVQIPKLKETAKYKGLIEDYEAIIGNPDAQMQYYNPFESNITGMSAGIDHLDETVFQQRFKSYNNIFMNK